MTSFFDLDEAALAAWCAERGLRSFAHKQLLSWVYQRGVADPLQMTDLSRMDREMLASALRVLEGTELRRASASDGTEKLLLGWPDAASPLAVANQGGRQTECVMIPADGRRTACVSSQVGCPVGCAFCASGVGGLEGNLTAGRIVEQVWRLSRLEGVERISHVVFMGMGEPLANFAAVTAAIRTLHAPWGFGISARRITVSTVGLPAAIRRLCTFDLPITLALSLHAPNDELRRRIIPWAEYATVAELLEACDEWFAKTGREITLEYILLGGFNDQQEHAAELASLCRRLRCSVNLIRYNEVPGVRFERPSSEAVHAFQRVLQDRGVNVHIRASRGRDIAAACGQLRHEHRAAQASR